MDTAALDAATAVLAGAIESAGARRIAVVTGAGISLASGIPTFRGDDPDAVWANDLMELGTFRYFEMNPAGSWRWYLERFTPVLAAAPNPAHLALARLERWHRGRGGRFVLVTQNVDPLHEQAGSDQLIKVHGSADRVRCTRDGCELAAPRGSLARADVEADIARFVEAPSDATLPRCPACGALLRQHVLWFDEFYDGHASYQWQRVLAAAAGADLLVFVGTSFAVGVTDLFLRAAVERRVPTFSIDPGTDRTPHPQVGLLACPAEALLPAVCDRLEAAG